VTRRIIPILRGGGGVREEKREMAFFSVGELREIHKTIINNYYCIFFNGKLKSKKIGSCQKPASNQVETRRIMGMGRGSFRRPVSSHFVCSSSTCWT